ncbi:aldo/keto reductase [Streptomyces sp. NPDC088725]|uniref:aldo/keto reductase n=1 Tax=Streptomyces sp. NPDC088725 TaxID=3365873 RepID=UPI00380A9E24
MNTLPGGPVTIAGKTVSRLGLGTMRLTGPGTWHDPHDRQRAIELLRRAVHVHGITHLDTADAYGPHTVEHLIREALHPFPEHLLVATKVGMIRPAPNRWAALGRPQYLRAAVESSLRRLKVERLDLCYLHRVDPAVPLEDQVGALAALRQEGKIGAIGLSKVTAEQIRVAGADQIVAVQNVLNMHSRYDPVLDFCADHNIAYVPYRPLNGGALATSRAPMTGALRWLLRLGEHVAPIPGVSSPEHLDELAVAAGGFQADGGDVQLDPVPAQSENGPQKRTVSG